MSQQTAGPEVTQALPGQQQMQSLLFPELEPVSNKYLIHSAGTEYSGEDDGLGDGFVYCR